MADLNGARTRIENNIVFCKDSHVSINRNGQLDVDCSVTPVVDVILPEQKITGGTVQIVVVESRVGRVIIQGSCWTNPKHLPGSVWCTRSGGQIYEPGLRNDLYRLNEYPFRRVDVELVPGQQDGTSDVHFNVHDVLPFRGYVGYDDTGVPLLGRDRLFAGFTVGGLLGADSLLSYQGTTDGDFHRLNAHSVFYQVPINPMWWFESYGSWAGVDPIIVDDFGQEGESWQTGFAFNRRLTWSLYEQSSISAGFDFKATNTNVEFGGVKVFDSAADLVTLRLGYRLFRRFSDDEYVFTSNDFFIGPGPQFSSGHTAEAFNTIRPGTSPDFVYNRLRMERAWLTANDLQFVARGVGQVASERLLFSETLGFGGFDSIRGYDQRTLNGDAGWLMSLELGPKPIRVNSGGHEKVLRMYGFVDTGDAYTIQALPGEIKEKFLVSTGAGMRMSINNRLALRIDYGYGFKEVASNPTNHRVHVGLVSMFGPQP